MEFINIFTMEFIFYLLMTISSVNCIPSSVPDGLTFFNERLRPNSEYLPSCHDPGQCNMNEKASKMIICATNGVTYMNACKFSVENCENSRIKFKHFGECTVKEKCEDEKAFAILHNKRVPRCNPDGTYHRIQCETSTGLCWCVNIDGKPDGSKPSGGVKPNCKDTTRSKSSSGKSSTRLGKSGLCPGKSRRAFNKRIVNDIKKEFVNRKSEKISGNVLNSPAFVKQAIQWKFEDLDKNRDQILKRKEYKKFKKLIKDKIKPAKCAKNFPKICDLNLNKRISLEEWMTCFNSTKGSSKKGKKNVREKKRGPPVPQIIYKEIKPPCQKERDQFEDQEGNETQFRPECDERGMYKPVQCYGIAEENQWYCFCVHKHTGAMIQNTSRKDGIRPDCSGVVYKWPECPDETAYLIYLFQHFEMAISAYEESNTDEILDYDILHKRDKKEIAQLYFKQLDKDRNNKLEGNEQKPIKKIVRRTENELLKTCGRRILQICDKNKDSALTMNEWLQCLLSSATDEPKNSERRGGAINPFIDIIKPY